MTFEIEPQGDQVMLTVTRHGMPAGSRVHEHISRGWPLVLSGLKSFLETGRVLCAPWYEQADEARA